MNAVDERCVFLLSMARKLLRWFSSVLSDFVCSGSSRCKRRFWCPYWRRTLQPWRSECWCFLLMLARMLCTLMHAMLNSDYCFLRRLWNYFEWGTSQNVGWGWATGEPEHFAILCVAIITPNGLCRWWNTLFIYIGFNCRYSYFDKSLLTTLS